MSPIEKKLSRTRNPPMHRVQLVVPEPAVSNPTNEEMTAQQARLLALRAANPRTNNSVRPLRVAAKTIRNKNKRLVALDKSHVKLFKENGVQSLCFVHSPNNKGTSWGHNVCGPDAQRLLDSPIGREFLASWKRMSNGLEAGGVPLRQPPLPHIENALDLVQPGQQLLENGRTTPANDDSNREDEQRNASPVDRPSVLESELSKDCFEAGGVPLRQPPLPHIENALDLVQPGQQLLENGRTPPANDDSNREDSLDRYASPMNRPSMFESELSKELSNPNVFAESEIHTTPVESQILNDTAREARSSTNSSMDTLTPDQTSRSSTPFPSEPFPTQQNETNSATISRIPPFLFPVFSGQDKTTPWTPPPTPEVSKLTDITVAPKNRRRVSVSKNRASQSQVNAEKVNDTQVPSGRGNTTGSRGALEGNRLVQAKSNKSYKITDAYLFNQKYYIKLPGTENLIPFNFDARFGIPKHITIHEMETAQKSS